MGKLKSFFDKSIGKFFKSTADSKIVASINIENVRNLYRFSIIVMVLESVSLALFMAVGHSENFWRTVLNVGCCIVACVLAVIISKLIISKYAKTGNVSNLAVNLLVAVFYILLSFWGALTDVVHYQNGDQMLTFYIVQFCFICFVVMRPNYGSITIAVAFAALYLGLFFVDGAESIQPLNYFVFAVIAVLGNAIKYFILQESEKNKVEILELNQILRQEAAIDDLTKLKNRNALNRDFDNYIGKFVCVIMADVDYFKRYNDNYGHLVGDSVLNRVASATKAVFGEDVTYRYGGDEFLIMLSGCSESDFGERIEQWNAAIGNIDIPNIIPITCSSGCGYGIPENRDDLKELIKKADENLYQAKKLRLH